MVGETGFIESLSAKILVIKTDSTGELIWKKEFGKAGFNLGNALVENNNGNYIIAGSLDSSAALITVDAKTGDALPGWPKTYALHNESSFETVVIAENGDIIAGGYEKGIAEGTFYNEGVGVVVITDSTGVEKKSIDLSEYISTAYRIKASEDGYFIASHPVIETDTYDLIKIDKKGEFLFEKSYEGDLFWGFDRNEAGDMLLAGHTTDCPLSDNWDIIATSVDNTGLERWTTYTGQPTPDNHVDITPLKSMMKHGVHELAKMAAGTLLQELAMSIAMKLKVTQWEDQVSG